MNTDGHPGVPMTLNQIRAKGVEPEDIDPVWIDGLVRRLFKALEVQLARIESTMANDRDLKQAQVRAANIRALSVIQQTLERLSRLEQQRAAARKVRASEGYEEIRAEIERRIDRIALTFKAEKVL